MCKWGTDTYVIIEQRIAVDSCIAEEIKRLNKLGVYTVSCCCGHGTSLPSAVILPSTADRARALGYEVTYREKMYPTIELTALSSSG